MLSRLKATVWWLSYSCVLIVAIVVLKYSTQRAWDWVNSRLEGYYVDLGSGLHVGPRSGTKEPSRIVIIREDNSSKRDLGVVDFRKYHGELLRILSHPRVAVVGFDHHYTTPTQFDEDLARAMRNSAAAVVVGEKTSAGRLRNAAKYLAHLEVRGFGGLVTHIPAVFKEPDRCVPSFAVAVVLGFYRLGEDELGCGDEVKLGPSFAIPTDERWLMVVNYAGGRDGPRTFRYADVVNSRGAVLGTVLGEAGRKIVLVGAEEGDSHSTPVGRRLGVEIQAQAIATILGQSYVKEVGGGRSAVAFVVLLVLLVNVAAVEVRRRVVSAVQCGRGVLLVGGIAMVMYMAMTVACFLSVAVFNAVALYVGVIGVATLANWLLARAGWLPGGVLVPAKGAIGVLTMLLGALMVGRSVLEAVVWAGLVVVGVRLVAVEIPRIVGRLAVVIVVVSMLGGAAEAATEEHCGTLAGITEGDGRGSGNRVRVVRERETREAREGDAVFHGDELVVEKGIGLRVEWAGGGQVIYEPSLERFGVTVGCWGKRLRNSVKGFWGTLAAFVVEGSRMNMEADEFGDVGTTETAFLVAVDRGRGMLRVDGLEGVVSLTAKGGAAVKVGPLESATVDQEGAIRGPKKVVGSALRELRDSLSQVLGSAELRHEARGARILAALDGMVRGEEANRGYAWTGTYAKNWPSYGGDGGNSRFSPLSEIDVTNVNRLAVAWVLQLGTLEAQEATPLVIGDALYVAASAGPRYVYAVDAKTGTIRWKYAPEIPLDVQQTTCCGLGNRGVAYARGKVFVTRLDGHLVALDADTGKEAWKAQVVDYKSGAAITSPPTIAKNLVITGFAGGEYGIRGYISAFDQDSGREVWRTYTVAGPGEPGHETWKGDSWQRGGGAAWYVGSYDAQLNLVYYGASNPAPWGASVRGADSSELGQYTNLYTASQLALDADTGRIVWHYQTTPYDAWDYDGVNEAVLVDAVVGGQTTPVLFKADRNGFFYVLNRKTGQLISAEPYVHVNWAKAIDKATGRPIEVAEKRPRLNVWARDICPNLFGGKNWEPMSYSPQTGLVYIPSFNLCMDLIGRTQEYKRGNFYLASEWELAKVGPGDNMSEMIAWDPIKQKKVWGNKEELPFMGGALSTAGGLVFHGNIQGWFKALDARTGKVLWQFNAGSGITAGPISYEIDGKQYVAVVSGRLKTPPSFLGWIGEKIFNASPEGGALFAFKLAGHKD